ncbi:GNAT family N-acetyltransferase [Mucilaginibacter sp. FT3.2]|uniref:GNAT family N-acetyltransferase n=1 Tax=Mucilaginibacter sp. FT3.2 TaxID=2723090 RepID=UPI001619BA75|nr:GNAT family N-acetyltransferase [Mucilaginibacter sp. FT3.2]MBB6234297.1 hypothetical protein [Mucilaginibacter sp. FT3.2]
MDYKQFTVRDKDGWDAYIHRAFIHDVFHSWHYHSLSTEGEQLLFVYEQENLFIALPVIKRKIENSPFFDMTSVYGYGGPMSNVDLRAIPANIVAAFKLAFIDFMKHENAICIFCRLHPFMNQHHILESIGGLKHNGTTLYIDLSTSINDQRDKYKKRLYRKIKKMREKGYIIKDNNSPDEIKYFIDMYYKNMDRVNASSNYYFDEKYFSDIINMEGYENKLILIYNGTELICGAVLLLSGSIIRNHLSATSPNYLKESPSKLLTDEISIIGRKLGKKIFHLGGGVGGKEDSLFEFKSYFSDLQITDHIWCYVNDHDAYNNLVAKSSSLVDSGSNYFPLYRRPAPKAEVVAPTIDATNA